MLLIYHKGHKTVGWNFEGQLKLKSSITLHFQQTIMDFCPCNKQFFWMSNTELNCGSGNMYNNNNQKKPYLWSIEWTCVIQNVHSTVVEQGSHSPHLVGCYQIYHICNNITYTVLRVGRSTSAPMHGDTKFDDIWINTLNNDTNNVYFPKLSECSKLNIFGPHEWKQG